MQENKVYHDILNDLNILSKSISFNESRKSIQVLNLSILNFLTDKKYDSTE
ncbi:hypothetical protein RCH18_000478 [Flavobacterium sp. PL11]|jgi:hypothetical protein|nr:hypothetical protein [Flavobacterium sp. PL11]